MYNPVKIVKGANGWGGPLTILPREGKDVILDMTTGNGVHPVAEKIANLSGGRLVDGMKTGVADEQIAVAVVDCGGSARCGVYPRKGVLTVNLLPTGKTGPLAQFINEDIYVSGVTEQCISAANAEDAVSGQESAVQAETEQADAGTKEEQANGKGSLLTRIGTGIGNVVGIFYQAGRDTIDLVIRNVLPFMAFIAMIMGIISASGLGEVIANSLSPLIGSIPGLLLLAFICGIPFISPILGPGAVIQQIIGTLIGSQIAIGVIPVTMALPALFAISTQAGCDFIAVALSMADAEPETIETGVPAMLFTRLFTGPIGVLIGWVGSIGIFGM